MGGKLIPQEPERFLIWVNKKLSHLRNESRLKILSDVRVYLDDAKKSQNVPYDTIIYSIKDKNLFLNSFLIRQGEQPLPGLHSLKRSLIVLVVILGLLIGLGFYGYNYFKKQFNFDPSQGDIQIFGQKLKVQKMGQIIDQNISGSIKYITRTIDIDQKVKSIRFDLDNTKTTFNFIEGDQLSLNCQTGVNSQFISQGFDNHYDLEIPGNTNCEINIPRRVSIETNFSNGTISLDQPLKSFKVIGNNGTVNWIKNSNSKYQMEFEFVNGKPVGEYQNILDSKSRELAQVRLDNGQLIFHDP